MGSVGHQRSALNTAPRFTVGRDHHGWWVVHDREDRVGGLFSSCDAALHFAESEACCGDETVCLADPDAVIELGAFTADQAFKTPPPRRMALPSLRAC